MVDFNKLLEESKKQDEIDQARGYREVEVFVYRCPGCGKTQEFNHYFEHLTCLENCRPPQPKLKYIEKRIDKKSLK
jgi:hypothetical protein